MVRAHKRQNDSERIRHYRCSDRITACSRGLFDRTHHRTFCCDESPILRGPLLQKSFRKLRKRQHWQQLRRRGSDGSAVAWITLTFQPLWLLLGRKTCLLKAQTLYGKDFWPGVSTRQLRSAAISQWARIIPTKQPCLLVCKWRLRGKVTFANVRSD